MKEPSISLIHRIQPRESDSIPSSVEPSLVSNENTGRKRRRRRAKQPLENFAIREPPSAELTPWLKMIPEETSYQNVEDRLHDEIVAYVRYMTPTEQEQYAREAVLGYVGTILKRRFSDGQVALFGSSGTGLFLPDGDIDIALSTKKVNEDTNKKKIMFQLAAMLKSSGLTDDVHVNHHARVPILIFTAHDSFGSYSLDVGINNTDGVKSMAIIQQHLSQMPALRSLSLIIKSFLHCRDLNSAAKGSLGSYAVICMCINYLQLNPAKLPAVKLSQPMSNRSLGLLVLEFFRYYGFDFPYETHYISVHERAVLPKENVSWIKPTHLDLVSIQCPLNHDVDLGKSATRFPVIRNQFKQAYENLTKASVAERNVLSYLVTIEQKLLDHRSNVAKIVDSGKLMAQTAAGTNAEKYGQHQGPSRGSSSRRYYPYP